MQATNTQLEQYNLSHHNFVEAYKMINEYVADLYQLPKKLVEDAGNALDNFCCEDSMSSTNIKLEKSCRVVIDFMDQLDEFTLQTIQLFNEHKKHVDATRIYIRKVYAIQAKPGINNASKEMQACNELTLELNKLLDGLREIKVKADEMVSRLEKLELRWENVRVKMN